MDRMYWAGVGFGFVLSLVAWRLSRQYRHRKREPAFDRGIRALRADLAALLAVMMAALTRIVLASFVALVLVLLLFASTGEHRLGVGLTGVLAPDLVDTIEVLVVAVMSGLMFWCCYSIVTEGRRLLASCRRIIDSTSSEET